VSKRDKREESIRQGPQKVSFEDLQWLLERYGFWAKRSGGGSHQVFERKTGYRTVSISVPRKRPYVGRVFVGKVLVMIDRIDVNGEDVDDI